jgi:hypothetical protein
MDRIDQVEDQIGAVDEEVGEEIAVGGEGFGSLRPSFSISWIDFSGASLYFLLGEVGFFGGEPLSFEMGVGDDDQVELFEGGLAGEEAGRGARVCLFFYRCACCWHISSLFAVGQGKPLLLELMILYAHPAAMGNYPLCLSGIP